ncbi:MAG TPA: hypothetical protein VFR18_02960, partial [Terriglobia bacterium]|nr:hypothetical protein [Terriglobia bacterium]
MRSFLNITRNLVLVAMATTLMANVATAQILSKAELKKLVAVANSPAEHERLAKHFDAKAAELEADAKDHDEMAVEYRKNPQGHDSKHPMSPVTAAHCEYFAKEMRSAAAEARKLAADHRAMAKTPVK